ncbi:MAG: YCF48-related protein [Shewanella sp.]|nr:YCF48-related protein [Shewanella sp.]MCF1430432.1 YCF48-related protein [Shewanella sp.]MCF1437320.1 YCF48-related protein [Shewanella sp.]MCF1456934.1 YCF48-related protein [Shewanella sp.]
MLSCILRGAFAVSALALLALPVQATSVDPQIQPLAKSSLLLDLALAQNGLVSVGERGHVLLQQGDDWQQVATPVDSLLTKVFFLDGQLGWAVGHDATILRTRDGGGNWMLQNQSVELDKPFLDVLFFNENEGVAIGAYGLFYRTLDSGQTWTEEFHGELLFDEDVAYLNDLKGQDEQLYLSERAFLLPHFNRLLQLNDGRLLLLGELGLVALSDDQGKTFEVLDFVYDGSMFNAIEVRDRIYLMGLRGHLFVTDRQFDQFEQVFLPVSATINAATRAADDSIWFVGNAGMVLRMLPSGEVQELAKRQGENIVAVIEDKQGRLWLSGTAGVVQLQQ